VLCTQSRLVGKMIFGMTCNVSSRTVVVLVEHYAVVITSVIFRRLALRRVHSHKIEELFSNI